MKIEIETYLYGRCHLFALALSRVFPYEMEFFWDEEAWFDEGEVVGTALVHAYCILPNHMCVDARGILSKEDILNDYDWNSPSYLKATKEMVEEWIKEGVLDSPVQDELQHLQLYIQENQHLYQLEGN